MHLICLCQDQKWPQSINAEPQVTGDNFCSHYNVLTSDQMSVLTCCMPLLPDKIIMPACSSTLHLVITSLSLENRTELFGRCDILQAWDTIYRHLEEERVFLGERGRP